MHEQDKRRDFNRTEFDDLATALGRAVLSWNDLHVSLGSIFWALTRIPNGMGAGAIWHSLTSDRAQRDLIRELCSLNAIGFELSSPLQSELEWLLKKVDTLSQARNDIIHTPFIEDKGRIFAFHLGQHKRGLKLEGQDICKYCAWLYENTVKLRSYADEVEERVRTPADSPFTRPTLSPKPAVK